MPERSLRRLATAASVALGAVMSAALLAPPAAGAQAAPAAAAAPVPCRDSACQLVFDWGGGQTASSFPEDRRYGSGDDFESQVRSVLNAKVYRLTETATAGGVVLTLRPRMRTAMCDALSGTNTDMTCKTIGDLAIVFGGGDATMKAPGPRTLRNTCGDATVVMSMSQFGRYTGEMLAFFVEGEKKGERRPSTKC